MDKFGRKLTDFFTQDNDEEELEEAPATSDYEEPTSKGVTKTDAKMIIFEPRSYDEATNIADYLKVGKACVVNLHRLQNEYRQRLIDILWGVVYAIDGQIQQVGTDVFLCTPRTMAVNGAITTGDD